MTTVHYNIIIFLFRHRPASHDQRDGNPYVWHRAGDEGGVLSLRRVRCGGEC